MMRGVARAHVDASSGERRSAVAHGVKASGKIDSVLIGGAVRTAGSNFGGCRMSNDERFGRTWVALRSSAVDGKGDVPTVCKRREPAQGFCLTGAGVRDNDPCDSGIAVRHNGQQVGSSALSGGCPRRLGWVGRDPNAD